MVCNGIVEVIVTGYCGGQRCVFRKGLDKSMVGKSISGNATSWSTCNLRSPLSADYQGWVGQPGT